MFTQLQSGHFCETRSNANLFTLYVFSVFHALFSYDLLAYNYLSSMLVLAIRLVCIS